MNNIYLYGPVYQGSKLTFNTTKHRAKQVQGIAVQYDDKSNIIIIRDKENFTHCIDATYAEEIDTTKKGIHYTLIQKQ